MKRFTYAVTAGRTAVFPMDMLRYAESFPATSEAGTAIERTFATDREPPAMRPQIELTTYLDPRGMAFYQSASRWASFGWRVLVRNSAGDYKTFMETADVA